MIPLIFRFRDFNHSQLLITGYHAEFSLSKPDMGYYCIPNLQIENKNTITAISDHCKMLIYHGDRAWDYSQVGLNWFLDFETQF